MSTTVPRFDAHVSGEVLAAALAESGCAIVERRATVDAMDRLRADLAPWLDRRADGHTDFSGYRTRRVSALVARSEVARDLALDGLMLDVCDRLLLPDGPAYRLQVTHMVDIGPGEIRQEIHRDDGIYPRAFLDANPTLDTLVHGMWAVTDFTEENGATSLVPGSHRWADRDRVPLEAEIEQARMPKGSVALYLGSTLHGGGANRSSERRIGALLGYALGWLRQEENMYLTCPPAVASTFPERLQRLIGYEMFSRSAGWVDNAHPRLLLEEDGDFDAHRVL